MSIYHGYRFEGLAVLVIWAVFLVLVIIFDDAARQLLPWAFVILMGLVIGLCVASEYVLYRIHARSTQRSD